MIDALRCWLGAPRWISLRFSFTDYQVCAHCSAERGTRRHGGRP